MPMKPRQMVRLLLKHGYTQVTQNGSSHLKMFNPDTNITVMVLIHAKELGKGIERAILRETGLKNV